MQRAFPVVVSLLLFSCDLLELPAQKKKKDAEIALLRSQVEQLKEAQAEKERADAFRQAQMHQCLDDADADYWAWIKLNGGVESKREPGLWHAPTATFEGARRQKEIKIADCRARWGG